ncbi:hypothetical protein DMN91_006832 [Ooceraea biroi]|uniref:Uncharacterized protein n=1 Tax=Ooceraea biroi TaxID=2015173 RepID=A0A3L8DIE1_OOCBI|nr:hypothetical protein DMN91_006832 [Ooceraea biroi]
MDFVMAMLLQLRENTRYDFRGDNILKDECLKPYIEGWERQVYFNHNITLVVQGIMWIERKKFSILYMKPHLSVLDILQIVPCKSYYREIINIVASTVDGCYTKTLMNQIFSTMCCGLTKRDSHETEL